MTQYGRTPATPPCHISYGIYTPALAQEDCEQHTRLSFFFENRVSKNISILCLENDINFDFNLAPRVVKPFSSYKVRAPNVCEMALQQRPHRVPSGMEPVRRQPTTLRVVAQHRVARDAHFEFAYIFSAVARVKSWRVAV